MFQVPTLIESAVGILLRLPMNICTVRVFLGNLVIYRFVVLESRKFPRKNELTC